MDKKILEKELYAQMHRFCFLAYAFMQSSNDWGDGGEQQVKATFCRCLLKIPATSELSFSDYAAFTQLTKLELEKLQITKLSSAQIQQEIDNFRFTIGQKTYSLDESDKINHILQEAGSAWILQGGAYGHEYQFILGEGTTEQKGDYHVTYLTTEHLRTPNSIIAMAAIIGEKSIFLRQEALACIFQLKWLSMFQSQSQSPDLHHRLGQHLKEQVLAAYHVHNQAALLQRQTVFLKDMSETILHHELGHGIVQQHTLAPEVGALSEASRVLGENILTALLEVLADLAPAEQGVWGPLKNIQKIAQSAPERALAMYYMYFSDTWFFDTEDQYMYLYSEIMAICLLSFDVTKPGFPAKQPELFTWLSAQVTTIAQQLQIALKDQEYFIAHHKLDFAAASLKITQQLQTQQPDCDPLSYAYRTAWWTELIKTLATPPEISQLLDQHSHKLRQELLIYLIGTPLAQAHNFNILDYVTVKLKLEACY